MAQISVIIPVYNIEDHLEQCLDSVAGQTFTDIEIICVDDGSIDKSSDILSRYAAQDNRFQILTQRNAGPGAARNAGLARAVGEYVIFLDSDDWFELEFLEQMLWRIQEARADLVICRAVEFNTEDGEDRSSAWMLKEKYLPKDCFRPEEAADHLFQFTYGWAWDKLYRTDFLRSSNLSYPDIPNSEDLVFVFQSLAMARRIAIVDKVLVHHRVNRMASVSHSRNLEPEVPYQAMLMLRNSLRKNNLDKIYKRSFVTWAIEFLTWHVANIEDYMLQKFCYKKLKQEWLPEIGYHRGVNFTSWCTYIKYLLIKYTPYLLFAMILSGYRDCKNILERQRIVRRRQKTNPHEAS